MNVQKPQDPFNFTRTGPLKFYTANFSAKQPGVRLVRYQQRPDTRQRLPQSPPATNKFDFITIKASGTQQNFYKKPTTTTTTAYQRMLPKRSATDLYGMQPPRNLAQTPLAPSLQQKSNGKAKYLTTESDNANGRFFVNVSLSNFEDEATECTQNTQNTQKSHKRTSSITESTGGRGRVANFSTSTSSQNTLTNDQLTPYGMGVEGDRGFGHFLQARLRKEKVSATKDVARAKSMQSFRTFKTLDRIVEAKEKAKIYDDHVVRQHNFNKQDQEEEQDFLELCKTLKTAF